MVMVNNLILFIIVSMVLLMYAIVQLLFNRPTQWIPIKSTNPYSTVANPNIFKLIHRYLKSMVYEAIVFCVIGVSLHLAKYDYQYEYEGVIMYIVDVILKLYIVTTLVRLYSLLQPYMIYGYVVVYYDYYGKVDTYYTRYYQEALEVAQIYNVRVYTMYKTTKVFSYTPYINDFLTQTNNNNV